MTSPADMVLRELEMEMVVTAVDAVSDDAVALTMTPRKASKPLPPWTPGAHIDVLLEGDDGQIVRQYSLCGEVGAKRTWQIGVLRVPQSRGGSSFVHDRIAEGDVVRVRGPRNHFALAASPRYVFVAGGIGITPILPMIAQAQAEGAEWSLHYGGRSRSSMAFLDRLEQYGSRVHLVPEDEVGRLDLQALLGEAQPHTLVYCCGPEGLLSAVEAQCAHWPAGSLHLERFSAKDLDTTLTNTEFDVVLERSGRTLHIPADKTIYEVCRDNDVPVLASCLAGICGTCETDVLEGEVEHRDAILDDEERELDETMMICVSRCIGPRLILDL